MLAGLYVPFGFSTCSMPEHTIQLILSGMTLQGATIFGAATMFLEFTAGTQFRRRLIFIVVSVFVIMSSVEGMSRRTAEGVGVGVIGEGLFGEDPLLST